MRTKLEAIAAYLAGRGSDDDAKIQAELDDPSSEVSRFLASTRSKSKAILDAPSNPPDSRDRPRSPWPWVAIAVLGLVGVAGLAGLVETRFRRLEAALGRSRVESIESTRHLLDAIEAGQREPPSPSIEPSLKAIEARLELLARRLDRPSSVVETPKADANLAGFRVELEAIRREVLASERANARQVQELRALIQELGQSIRRATPSVPTSPEPRSPRPER